MEILYRNAETQYDRVPLLTADLVNRRVHVIFAVNGTGTALAATAATPIIPIVFANGGIPSKMALSPPSIAPVATSLARRCELLQSYL